MAQSWKKRASVAYGYSLTRLTLNMCLYFEDIPSSYDEAMENQRQIDTTFMRLVNGLMKGDISQKEVDALREKIKAELEVVIACADSFQNYEYALKRVERRFTDGFPAPDLTDEEFADQIMGFIMSEKDEMTVNRKIQEVIGQLPIRFTRQKYYGMVHDALSAYIGSDMESLDNMMYLLRVGSMTELSQEQMETYPEFAELLKKLAVLSFKELTAEQYREAQRQAGLAMERLTALSEYFQTLEEMVNDLYVLCLTKEDAIRDTLEEAHACGILKELCALYETGGREIPETVEEMLWDLEGIQESCYEKYLRMDPAPEYRDGEDETAFKSRCVERLLSTSVFVSLDDREMELQNKTVERTDVEAAFNDFAAAVDPVLVSCQKPVMRAVMASTLSCLPICFNSLDEIRDYIENSLASCTDRVEKEACMEQLQQLMEIEDYAMV